VSAARRLVLMALFAADWPVTADQIAAGHMGLPPSDIASIYRNLEMLEQQGLVYHLHLGHRPRSYRLVSADEPCYVVCERCERVDAVSTSQLDDARAAIRDRIGYRAGFTHYPIVGVCPACSAADPADQPPGLRA
jgi:Fur family ferric uptake transcriptional regulator